MISIEAVKKSPLDVSLVVLEKNLIQQPFIRFFIYCLQFVNMFEFENVTHILKPVLRSR